MLNADKQPHFLQEEQYSLQLGAFLVAAQSSPMPTMISDSLVPGGSIVFANNALLEMTGFNRNDLLGNSIKTLFGPSADAETISLFESTIANGGAGQWQATIRRSNKSSIFSVVYISPIYNDERPVKNHVLNFFDINSMIGFSREKHEIYPAIYDKAPDFIAISNGKKHKFTYANAAFKAFIKRDALIGKTVADALPELVAQGLMGVLDEVYQTGVSFRGTDLPVTIEDSEKGRSEHRWMDVVYQPVRDDSGAIIGLFCEGHDVTDLHEANETLAALQSKIVHATRVNAMGTMAATLAHELNQPLTAISNYLAGVRPLEGSAPDISRLTMALEGIKDASERAAGIIDHIRQLTKHSPPSQEPFNLKKASDECILLVRSSCRAGIEFKNCIAADLIMIGDHVKIQQVLINLLQNACDAMADSANPVVRIDAVQDDQNLTVSVADTGSGVSSEAAATIFAWTQSSKNNGMGIGLSICRTIIELHRGKIWLERTGPGGSEFRFSVPVA